MRIDAHFWKVLAMVLWAVSGILLIGFNHVVGEHVAEAIMAFGFVSYAASR